MIAGNYLQTQSWSSTAAPGGDRCHWLLTCCHGCHEAASLDYTFGAQGEEKIISLMRWSCLPGFFGSAIETVVQKFMERKVKSALWNWECGESSCMLYFGQYCRLHPTSSSVTFSGTQSSRKIHFL